MITIGKTDIAKPVRYEPKPANEPKAAINKNAKTKEITKIPTSGNFFFSVDKTRNIKPIFVILAIPYITVNTAAAIPHTLQNCTIVSKNALPDVMPI